MSAQTITYNTDTKISTQLNDYLAKSGKNYLLYKRFQIGEKTPYKEIRNICRLIDIFCQDRCYISEEDMILVKENINKILIYNG